MTVIQRFALVALASLPLLVPPAFAQGEKSWDGVWSGVQGKGHAAPIQLSITDGSASIQTGGKMHVSQL